MAQITIIGLGSVGSSLGLALHRYMQAPGGQANQFTIVGFDPDLSKQDAERRAGSVDRFAWDYASAVQGSPFVVIPVPIGRVRPVWQNTAPHLHDGVPVRDPAPNKRLVLQWAGKLPPPGVTFIGAPPLPHRRPAPAV